MRAQVEGFNLSPVIKLYGSPNCTLTYFLEHPLTHVPKLSSYTNRLLVLVLIVSFEL